MKKPKIKTTYTISVRDEGYRQEAFNFIKRILNKNCECKLNVIIKDEAIKIKMDYIDSYDVSEMLLNIMKLMKINSTLYFGLCKNIEHSVMKFDICMNESVFPCIGIEQEYVSFLYDMKARVEYELHLEKMYEMETDNHLLKAIDDDKFISDDTKIMAEFFVYSTDNYFNVETFNKEMDIDEARYWKKGDVWSKNRHITRLSRQNIWEYKTNYIETFDMGKVLKIILGKIKNKDEIIIRASKVTGVTVALQVVFGIEKNLPPNINISNDLIKYVHKINASFLFDPYWYS